jgi:hypothetical protein
MHTRQDYLNGIVSHEDYYSQFVTELTKNLVNKTFGFNRLESAYKKDHSFNTIPLASWDNLTYLFNPDKELKSCGDYSTLAGKVCILKESARQLVNNPV